MFRVSACDAGIAARPEEPDALAHDAARAYVARRGVGVVTKYDDIAAAAAVYSAARAGEWCEPGRTPAESVLLARVALAEAILDAGWLPNPEVARRFTLDLHLSQLPSGAGDREPQVQGSSEA